MSALYLLIGFSMLVALIFLGAFFWAMRSNQYKDTHTPAMRILFDDKTSRNRRSRDSLREGN